jgi:hypothetical protein
MNNDQMSGATTPCFICSSDERPHPVLQVLFRSTVSVVPSFHAIENLRDAFGAFFGLDMRVGIFGGLKRAVA